MASSLFWGRFLFPTIYSHPYVDIFVPDYDVMHVYNSPLSDTFPYGILEYRKHLYSFTLSITVDVDIWFGCLRLFAYSLLVYR